MLNFLIGGLKKSTLLDFPNKLSAIVFTQGCNFNCGFCHNPSLLTENNFLYSPEDFFNFLETRKNKLDGVVISGGEPTLQPDLKPFIQKIKQSGFLVKLDTNGYKPDILEDLLKNNLLDYVAMDIKSTLSKYSTITRVNIDTDKIKKSIDLLLNSNIDYEFRTTFMPYYHSINDFKEIGNLIKGAKHYYLQKFEAKTQINNPSLQNEKNFSDEDIEKIITILKHYINDVQLR